MGIVITFTTIPNEDTSSITLAPGNLLSLGARATETPGSFDACLIWEEVAV